MCNNVFYRKFDISGFYCNICLYWTNTEDLNNAGDEVPIFKLYDITGYLSLYYLTTEKYKK